MRGRFALLPELLDSTDPPVGGTSERAPEPWPKDASPGETRVIAAGNLPAYIPHVFLPKGFTLRFADAITDIKISVGTLEFGSGAVIDLSHPLQNFPNPPSAQPPTTSQPSYGEVGHSGANGLNGSHGAPGKSLAMQVQTVVPSGSLWVRTDGGYAQQGGRGGAGGPGGGSRCYFAPTAEVIDGGRGGPGGRGGNGGIGGNTSAVGIWIKATAGFQIVPAQCRPENGWETFPGLRRKIVWGPSPRPEGLDAANDGTILISGMPGRGGFGGPGGDGGSGAEGRSCDFGRNPVSGAKGETGQNGEIGAHGACNTTAPTFPF